MVGARPRDDLHLPRVAPRLVVGAGELDGRLVRRGAAVDEEEAVEPGRRDAGESRGQLDPGRMGEAEERRAERELAHLARDGVHDVLAPVPAVDVPQGGEAVDERPPLGVVQVDALAADEDARAVLRVLLEGRRRVKEVGAVERGEPVDLLVAERQACRHAASLRRYHSTRRFHR